MPSLSAGYSRLFSWIKQCACLSYYFLLTTNSSPFSPIDKYNCQDYNSLPLLISSLFSSIKSTIARITTSLPTTDFFPFSPIDKYDCQDYDFLPTTDFFPFHLSISTIARITISLLLLIPPFSQLSKSALNREIGKELFFQIIPF